MNPRSLTLCFRLKLRSLLFFQHANRSERRLLFLY
ncbi:hypothetical protein I7I53_01976 [Histoplasma capsulatum var. duboisii H88]|uniref:Uncharacterized protein n=1 Tax=Ajellomyces capsulatus (strain H88) TaxID=544711 RepID=A0A8A1LPS2_AJEC8|nr:hypothetical protein I7I53_01976 [Histoplasma capsulatum var. duboisii H88]